MSHRIPPVSIKSRSTSEPATPKPRDRFLAQTTVCDHDVGVMKVEAFDAEDWQALGSAWPQEAVWCVPTPSTRAKGSGHRAEAKGVAACATSTRLRSAGSFAVAGSRPAGFPLQEKLAAIIARLAIPLLGRVLKTSTSNVAIGSTLANDGERGGERSTEEFT